MKRSHKLFLYISFVIIIYLALIFSIYTPADLSELIFGPNEHELGIISYKIQSIYQEGSTQIKVLLPKNIDVNKRYKVLYVLPVTAQWLDCWWINGLRVLAKSGIADKYDLIFVSPMFSRAPWYADHPANPKIRQESYIIKDVIPFVDANLKTIQAPEGRYLIGFSRSGFGALSLLLRNLDTFGGAAVWDGTLSFEMSDNRWESGLKEVFETEENFRKYYIPDLIQQQSLKLKHMAPKIVLMGYCYPNTKRQALEISQLLSDLGIAHVCDVKIRRKHIWSSGWMVPAVEYLFGKEM